MSLPESPKSSSPRRKTPPLTLDLSQIPSLVEPPAPTNTLLLTNLLNPDTFHPTHIATIRDLITRTYPLHSFAPLKSFKRIIVSFWDVETATAARESLNGTAILGHRVKIYYGEPTPVVQVDNHLPLPQSDRLFFISPPPSPPHGWEIRNEGPPNKEVHAEDLASALAKLHARPSANADEMDTPVSAVDDGAKEALRRQRSGSSTIVYHPSDHGDSPNLPAIAVEDLTVESPSTLSADAMEGVVMEKPKTSRPPVELMHS